MAIHGSSQTRFGDTPLTFGLVRYEASDKRFLWRFEVLKYCGHNPLISVDITIPMLVEMRGVITKAIETLSTDGGRKPVEEEQKA